MRKNERDGINGNDGKHISHTSHDSHPILPPHGGYKNLLSFQKTEIVYDATVFFCDRFVDKRSRTHDQMIQAARSGKQNIVEGSQVSGTSKEMELKLTGVARASLEELLTDFCDFLRTRKLPLWDKNHPKAQAVRKMSYGTHVSYETYRSYVEHGDPETAANTIICLIHQTNYLLDQQLRRLEQDFLKEGGLRERMTRARLNERAKQNQRAPGDVPKKAAPLIP